MRGGFTRPPHCCCEGSMKTCSVIYSVGEYCGQREVPSVGDYARVKGLGS